jgi:hypothetical protein
MGDILEGLKPYFDMIEAHGISIDNPRQMEDLLCAIRYTECRYSEPHLREEEICARIGAKQAMIGRLKGTKYIAAASRIVLAQFLTDEARRDARQLMFSIYQQYIPLALENVARIAACQMPDGVPKPAYKEQVSAFREFANNPMAQAWLTNTFIGETPIADEDEYLQIREKLLQKSNVLKLDAPAVDAEFRDVSREPAPAGSTQEASSTG